MSRPLVRLFITAIAAVLLAPAARAQTYTWNTPATDVWSNAARWDLGVPPSDPTTALVFNAAGETYTATNDLATNPFVLNRVTFNNTGSGVITVAGNPLSFAGTTPTVNVSAGSAAIANVLTGATLFTKSGAGTLSLSGASTNTGGVTVGAGRLAVAGPTVTTLTTNGFPGGTITSGPVGTGAVTVAAGATLSTDGANRALRNTVTIGGTTANPSVIDVAAGELTLTGIFNGGASSAVTKTGAGFLRLTGGSQTLAQSVGTITINGGTVQLTDATNPTPGTNTNGTATVVGTGDLGSNAIIVNNTGTFIFGNSPAFGSENPDLPAGTYITVNTGGNVVWNVGEDYGGVNLFGGAVQMNSNMNFTNAAIISEFRSGNITGNSAIGGTGSVNKTTAGTVTVAGPALTFTGALGVQDGVFSTDANFSAATAANTASPTNTLTLGTTTTAGTVQYTGASQVNARPVVLNGLGGTIDVTSAGTTLTLTGTPIVAVPTATPPIAAQPAVSLAGSGPLTKTGAGTLALTALLNQTGTVTIAGGAVRVNPVTSAGGLAVQSGGTLAVNSGAGTATFTTPTLAFSGAGAALRFELTSTTPPTVPLVTVSAADGLTLGSGGATLAITTTAASLPIGQFPLLDYAGTPITSGFNLALQGRTTGNLVYDTANTRIDVNVTGSDSIRWTGAINNTWDVGTAANAGGTNNWVLVNGGTATNFIQGDVAVFDDTSTVRTVNVTTAVQPAALTVDTADVYRFQGAGPITGTGSLTKAGAGTLVLATDATYTGATTITGGTLQFDNAADTTFPSNITGTTAIVKTGTGAVSLSGESQGFTGTLTINAGAVRLINDADLNAPSIVVNNGGTFQFGPGANPNLPEGAGTGTVVTANPGGTIIWLVGEQIGGFNIAGGAAQLTSGVTFNQATEFRSGTINGPGAMGGAGSIAKTTTGTLTITGSAVNTTGAILLDGGTLSTDSAFATAGPATGTALLTFGSSDLSTLRYRGTAANVVPVSRPVSLGEAGAAFDITQAAGVFTLAGDVSGGGSGVAVLTKLGAGTLVLNGTYDTPAPLAVAGGALVVNGGVGATSGSGTGGATVASGGVLAGTGTIGGAVSVASGGAIQGGNPTTASVGTLTVNANVSVPSGAAIRTRLAAPTAADALTLTGGGTLALSTGSRLDLRSLPTFGPGGSWTIATVGSGSANLTLNGGTITDGSVIGRYVQGTGATGQVGIDVSNFGTTLTTGDAFALSRSGNSLVLAFTPVPEPTTVLGAAVGVLGLLGVVRRRVGR